MTSGAELDLVSRDTCTIPGKAASVSDAPACMAAARFVSQNWPKILAVSALLLVPCFWHRHIVASDLGSHLYNAWLTQLIHRGQAPGLWLSGQWTNVLFDWILAFLSSSFGFLAAEKIAVSLCVLVFFWGAFAFAAASSGRAPWFLAPLVAVFAYGWTFHLGLYNYYLSIGLSFFCLAVFWRGTNRERIAILPVAILIAVAHPFGVFWLAAACIFVAAMRFSRPNYHAALLLVAAAGIWAVRYFLTHRYITEMQPNPAFFAVGGLDQIYLFGARYRIVQAAAFIFVVTALLIDLEATKQNRGFRRGYILPLQLYVVVELAVLWLPRGVTLPGRVPIALITERLTSISAVALCCVLAMMRPAKWHLAASLVVAGLFASFLYQDTAAVNRIEAQAERLVHTLPPNQRVLASIYPLENSRILIQHNIDLACIAHCFSYGNYEPGSAVFRVRAAPGNPYVLADYGDAVDTEDGTYQVQPEDLPIYQVYQCTETGLELCIRPLAAGEENNRLGVYQR